MAKPIEPLDAGQRNRRAHRKRRARQWARLVLRNRWVFLAVLWVAKVIVFLVRLVKQFNDGS